MKATFENSVNVLVKAYFNDTLRHLQCSACACGNLIGSADWAPSVWQDRLSRGERSSQYFTAEQRLRSEETLQNSTTYTANDLCHIENAFMGWDSFGTQIESRDIFQSLLRVVDVLAEIHGVDLTAKENAIGQFQKVKHEKQTA